jgi:Fur family ferric uptake transcriptional regulator
VDNKENFNTDYTFDEYLKLLRIFLRKNKMRNTYERVVILRSVYEQQTHFTIDSLKEYLREKKHYVSETTLYLTLKLLTDIGLVIKHHFSAQSVPQYEKFYTNRTHNHIYMEDTQTVIEFSDSRIEVIIKDMEEKYNMYSTKHSFIIYCNNNK